MERNMMKAALQHLVELLQKELVIPDRKGDLEFIGNSASFLIDQAGHILWRVGISRTRLFHTIDEFILYVTKKEESPIVDTEKRELL